MQRNEYCEGHERGVADDNLTVFVHPEPVPFGLALFGDRLAMVGAFDETGNVVAGFHGTDPVITDWAETVYREYRTRSHQLQK